MKDGQPNVDDKVCRFHPDRPAVSRCETCFRPLCEECAYRRGDRVFCSRNCAGNYDVVSRNIQSFENKKEVDQRLRFRRRTKRLLRVLFVVIAVFLAWWLFTTYNSEIRYWLDHVLHTMGN